MSSQLGTEHESEHGERQPRPQMWTDTADAPVCGQFEDHHVPQLQGSDPALADHDSRIPVVELSASAQSRDGSVHRVEQDPQVIAAAEHHVARERRDELRIV